MQHYSDHFASEGRMNITSMNFSKEVGSGASGILSESNSYHASSDTTLFSSSLPVLPHPKLILNNGDDVDVSSNVSKLLPGDEDDVDGNDLLDDVERHIIGNLLPGDEDELLAGIMDSYDLSGLGLPNESDDYDFFGSGGGLELELDPQENLSMGMSKMSLGEGVVGNGVAHFNIPNGVGTVAGEHPYGEHPSRTLFVRNINSNVEDSELKALFEQYGDIRTLFTQCKTRGFVMISYYDIRAARTAMRALQNKPLRRRKLDIHYSIPKDNPSDKDVNQGTLVVFNLDPSVSCEDLLQIFGAYGEVKEIRETPHKRHHKFIEYYDVRSAEAALRSLNRSDIAGKRIKLEPSRPGGARRNLLLQLNQDFEQDDSRTFRLQVGSSMANSPPGVWPQFGSPIEHSPLQSLSKSPVFSSMSPTLGNSLPGLASILHPQPARIAPIGKDHGKGSHLEHIFPNGNSNHGGGAAFQHSHSLPEPKLGQYSGAQVETLSGPQFLWGSPSRYNDQNNPSASWRSPSIGHHPFPSKGPSHGFPSNGRPGSLLNHHQHHHVGSAPSGIPFEGRFGHFHGSPETFFMSPPSGFGGGMGLGHVDRGFMGARGAMNSNMSVPGNGNITENGSSGFSTMSSQRLNPIFLGNGHFPVLGSANIDSLTERARNRRVEQNGNQMDSKKQFQLDLEKILSGKDNRTTLMIKNIPNKYTSKMLLAAIDENHKGTYDFLYLPIDFKNKCNVGYAFINMLSPAHIVPFYQAFNGKKWEKFNSEKVASLAYARIQGKAALVTHFQNSSLMNEDKRCRPILFHSDGLEGGDQIIQDPLQSSSLNIQNHNRSNGSESEYSSGSPGNDVAGERGMFPDHS